MGLFSSLGWALAQRALWTSRANNAWGSSRVWNSGSSFETDAANNLAQYNSEVTAFNNLQNGLNNPEGLTTASMSWPDLSGHGSSSDFNFGTFTLTLPRSGHFLIGYAASGSHTNAGFGTAVRFVVGGTAGLSDTRGASNWTNSGSSNFAGGYLADGNFTSGQTVTVALHGDFLNAGSASGTIYAHFVPDASHHN